MEVQGNDLRNYVKSIYNLEKSVLVQQNAIRALEGYVNSERKKLVPTDVPNDYNESGLAGNISSGILSALLFGATSAAGIIALAFITAIFASFISSIFSGYAFVALIFSPDLGGYCSYLVKPFFGFINVIKPFLPLAITTLIGIGFLLGMGGRSHEKSEKIKANNRKETILENNRQKTLLLEDLNASEAKNLNKMRAKLQESESLLNDFYSVGLIYPKYRSLIPMASISEYFEAGRCSTLGEAYNIFEMERKLGTIIDKLDIVIDKLDEISSQQRLVYEAVEASDKTIQNMSQAVNSLSTSAYSIQLDAAYAASNTQIIAKNSEYQRFLTMIR